MPLVHYLLGELYLYHSQDSRGHRRIQKELALDPGYAPAYYKLADAYSRIQKFDDAEKFLQRSIWLDATSTGPYILMGKVLQKKGESELAVRALQRALAMDPNNPVTHHFWARPIAIWAETKTPRANSAPPANWKAAKRQAMICAITGR